MYKLRVLFIITNLYNKKSIRLDKETIFKKYNDLDHLAGTWTNKEAKIFMDSIEHFEQVDKELWKCEKSKFVQITMSLLKEMIIRL